MRKKLINLIMEWEDSGDLWSDLADAILVLFERELPTERKISKKSQEGSAEYEGDIINNGYNQCLNAIKAKLHGEGKRMMKEIKCVECGKVMEVIEGYPFSKCEKCMGGLEERAKAMPDLSKIKCKQADDRMLLDAFIDLQDRVMRLEGIVKMEEDK